MFLRMRNGCSPSQHPTLQTGQPARALNLGVAEQQLHSAQVAVLRSMSVALVRRGECVPNFSGSRPMLSSHSFVSRAHWRTVKPLSGPPRPANKNCPGCLPVSRKYTSIACQLFSPVSRFVSLLADDHRIADPISSVALVGGGVCDIGRGQKI